MKFSMFLVLLTVTLSSVAQKDTVRSIPMLFRGLGVSVQRFEGLDARIANRPEYKELRDYAGVLELGWMRSYKRVISGLTLTAGSSMSGDRDEKSSTIRFLGAGLDFGYDILPGKFVMLFPLVGIGTQGYKARFYKDNSDVPFNDVLQFPGVQNGIRSVDFTNSFFTYRLGLGFNFSSPKHPYSGIGIQARYTGSFKDQDWKSSENQTLAGAPVDNLSQFQVALILTTQWRGMKNRMY